MERDYKGEETILVSPSLDFLTGITGTYWKFFWYFYIFIALTTN